MRKLIGALALVSAGLMAAAQPALAQTPPIVPTDPTGPVPDGTAGDGGLIVSVWSPSQTLSLTYYTGLTYSQVQPDDIAPDAGLVLDFGTIPDWSSISGATDLVYTVMAADGLGNAAARGFVTTAQLGLAPFTANNGDVNSITGSAAYVNYVGQLNGTPGQPNPNVFTGTTGVDAEQIAWDTRYGGFLDVSAAGNVGTALGFYRVAGQAPAANAQTPALVTRFQNSLGNLGQWLLTADGHLTYTIAGPSTVVPLPAAAWLLLSGLAGLGAVSRRRIAS